MTSASESFGDDLRVGELGSGTTLADAVSLEPVVYEEAEEGNDEGEDPREKTSFKELGWSLLR